jgi:hypothetical protein
MKLAALVLLSGCSMLAQIEGGYQAPFDGEEGRAGTAVNAHLGSGVEGVPAGLDLGLRTKLASDAAQVAFSAGGYFFTPPALAGAYGRAGIHILQLESLDGTFQAGAGSPFLELGVMVYPSAFTAKDRFRREISKRGGFFFSVSAVIEYDIRFTSAPNQAVGGLLVGVGMAGFQR